MIIKKQFIYSSDWEKNVLEINLHNWLNFIFFIYIYSFNWFTWTTYAEKESVHERVLWLDFISNLLKSKYLSFC